MKNINLKMIETEHGKFTDIEELGISAEECYKQYLVDKDKPTAPQTTEVELLKQELTTVQEAFDFLIMNGGI